MIYVASASGQSMYSREDSLEAEFVARSKWKLGDSVKRSIPRAPWTLATVSSLRPLRNSARMVADMYRDMSVMGLRPTTCTSKERACSGSL
jgi:hypothetical protein